MKNAAEAEPIIVSKINLSSIKCIDHSNYVRFSCVRRHEVISRSLTVSVLHLKKKDDKLASVDTKQNASQSPPTDARVKQEEAKKKLNMLLESMSKVYLSIFSSLCKTGLYFILPFQKAGMLSGESQITLPTVKAKPKTPRSNPQPKPSRIQIGYLFIQIFFFIYL